MILIILVTIVIIKMREKDTNTLTEFKQAVMPKNGSCGNVLLSNNQTRNSE